MIVLSAAQQAAVASVRKSVSWLFETATAAAGTFYWSTKARSFGGQSYSFKVLPESFKGIVLNRARSELGIQAPNDLEFEASNKASALSAAAFAGASVLVKLVVSDGTNEEIIRQWRFRVKSCTPEYQKLRFVCEDFLQQYLRGDYPNTRLVSDIFPASDVDVQDSVCVPVPFGTAYVPLRSVYIPGAVSVTAATISAEASVNGSNCKFKDAASGFGGFEAGRYVTTSGFVEAENNGTFLVLAAAAGELELGKAAGLVDEAAGASVTAAQGQRFYLLGSAEGGRTYTVSRVRSPRSWGKKSEWSSAAFSFNQYTKTGGGADWRVFQPIIADADKDGAADTPGLWRQGEQFLDMPAEFSCSETSAVTNPAGVIEYVLKDFGVPADKLDTGAGSSFEAAAAVFTGWGLTFEGAFWYKQTREKVLSLLLNMCHGTLTITDKVELHVLSKAGCKTVTAAEVIAETLRSGQAGSGGPAGEGTFRHRDISSETYQDSGYIAWQPAGEAQDRLLKTLVPVKDQTAAISGEILEVPFVRDSVSVQRIGTLYFQRKFLKQAEVEFDGKGCLLALCPDDVISVNEADYGGSYDVIVDAMTIRPDVSIAFSCIKLSESLDDWGDLAPDAVTVNTDDTTKCWEPTLGGPLSSEDLGRAIFEVWGQPYLFVGPSANAGQYTDIQDAVNALAESRHSGIFLLNGVYADLEIHLIDRSIEIAGESLGGVVLKNKAASPLFTMASTEKDFSFSSFTVQSQNSGSYTAMFSMTGNADFKSRVSIEKLALELADNGSSAGDYGVSKSGYYGKLTIRDLEISGGGHGISVFNSYCAGLSVDNVVIAGALYGIYAQVMYDYLCEISAHVSGFKFYGIKVIELPALF